jgi:cell division GTPase FtsZ
MANLLKDVINNLNVDGNDNLFDSSNKGTIISDNFDDLEEFANFKIKVFGIGGAGCNVVDYMLSKRK